MVRIGPISSIFDFATFAVMLWVFDAGAELFRSGWFVESLATWTLVVFVIRTRRTPFFRSGPSIPLLVSALVVAIGAMLPGSPFGSSLGFAGQVVRSHGAVSFAGPLDLTAWSRDRYGADWAALGGLLPRGVPIVVLEG